MAIKILIADDAAAFRAAERRLLEQAPELEVVAEAADASEAIELAEILKPDVIVVDLRMSRDGPNITAHLKAVHPPAKIVAVTALADPYIAELLKEKYRVDALLLKDKLYDLLVPTIKQVAGDEARQSAG